jgi:YjjI family glycine radical enzyme
VHTFEQRVRSVVEDPTLTFHQRRHRLAALAEDEVAYPPVSDACRAALVDGSIDDLGEGHAPYRPRYVLPDYGTLLRDGSTFLELAPARDLDEAITWLLCAYSQVPSITGYPVYLGDIDTLLEPFATGVSDGELRRRLRLFWIAVDRMFPDAFCHADLGPDDTRVGRAVFAVERELRQVVPNLTLRVDPLRTPDDYVLEAVRTTFETAKPHYVNHPMMVDDHGPGYGVVSCYNSLRVGGGSHTLVRLNLAAIARRHAATRRTVTSYLDDVLPHHVELTCELAEARVRHLVERARFFDHDWLAREQFVSLDRFSAMFGVYGLAEAVAALGGEHGRYGHDGAANELALRITACVADLVADRPMPYCAAGGDRCFLHSQSGIDSDIDVTAGTRVPVGDEPPLLDHLFAVAPHHRLFAAGVSDVLAFDDGVRRNPQAVVDVIRGAFAKGMRDFTFNLDSNDFIRITGYLVRKSDVIGLQAGDGARHGSTLLGAGSVANSHLDRRVTKRVVAAEMVARS